MPMLTIAYIVTGAYNLPMCCVLGTSANDTNFQAFLLEGIYRWNENRMSAAIQEGSGFERCYDARLKTACSNLSTALYGKSFVAPSRPMRYTGELFGIEYLFSQTGQTFHLPSADTDEEEDVELEESQELDEGFHDVEDLTIPVDYIEESEVMSPASSTAGEPATASAGAPESTVSAAAVSSSEEDVQPPPSGQEAVDRLAAYLVTLDTASFLTSKQTQKVVGLWNQLDEFDKRRVTYTPRFQRRLVSGRFRRVKTQRVVPGVESVRRAFVGPGTPAQRPSLSRVVDAICSQLVLKYRRPSILKTSRGRLLVPKWTKVMDGYSQIKHLLDNSESIRLSTTLQLFSINMHTLRQ